MTADAPLANSDLAMAIAAYEQLEDAAPSPVASATGFGPAPRKRRLDPLARHPRLHDGGDREPEHERPPDLPRHQRGVADAMPEDIEDRRHTSDYTYTG